MRGSGAIYLNETHSTDRAFWVLSGAGGYSSMALLAVVMFDGLHGLSPALLLGSILKTFVQYCARWPLFAMSHACWCRWLGIGW